MRPHRDLYQILSITFADSCPQTLSGSLHMSDPPLRELSLFHTSNFRTNSLYRSEHDQELDSLLVGPIPVGVNKFIFEADPPDLKHIPQTEILGVTVILLTCSYDGREFVRVGYYVNNEYDSEELNADPPSKPIIERVRRNVLAEKPRVTRFAIKWYVFFLRISKDIINEEITIGTPKSLRPLNTLLNNRRPTNWMTMERRMVPRRLSWKTP